MADVRLTPSLPAVAAPTPVRTNEAVRAAQRAFFDAALSTAASPSAPVRPQTPVAASPAPAVTTPRPSVQVSTEGRDPPVRPLRPGSLLDIRI